MQINKTTIRQPISFQMMTLILVETIVASTEVTYQNNIKMQGQLTPPCRTPLLVVGVRILPNSANYGVSLIFFLY